MQVWLNLKHVFFGSYTCVETCAAAIMQLSNADEPLCPHLCCCSLQRLKSRNRGRSSCLNRHMHHPEPLFVYATEKIL